MRRLGTADDAFLELGAADPAERPQEDGVDWLHVRVENIGLPKARQVQPAKGAWAEVSIEGRRFRLVWSTHAGPKHYMTIGKGASALIPLVVRAPFASAALHPEPGAAFITDLRALLYQNDMSRLLEPGRYRITLGLHWDPEQSRDVRLALTIPLEKHVGMSLEKES